RGGGQGRTSPAPKLAPAPNRNTKGAGPALAAEVSAHGIIDLPLGCRGPPRRLRPRLLQLALEVGDPPLELALVILEADHLAAQPTHLPAQGVDVVGDVVLVGLGWRPGRRCGYALDRDLLVRRPRFFARRARVACPLNAGADLVALL